MKGGKMLNFKETYIGELIAKYNEYEFKIYENYETLKPERWN